MKDIIYRQAAIAYAISGLTREFEGEKWIRVSEVRESLQTMPPAERHGRWDGDSCSVCGFSWCDATYDAPQMQMPYCPYCGARMDMVDK